MINYVPPDPNEWKTIAHLHARSWQDHYRGIFSSDYLDHEVHRNREMVWQKRFATADPTRHIITARDADVMCGFSCVFLSYHDQWGAYLDNLHVLTPWKGKGIGKRLMELTAAYVWQERPNSPMYLYVLKENHAAIAFYERLGGVRREQSSSQEPDGGSHEIYRYEWSDPRSLMDPG